MELLCRVWPGVEALGLHWLRTASRFDGAKHSKTVGSLIDLAVFFRGRCSVFVSFCVFVLCFPVPEPSKEIGDVFECMGDVFCIEFAYENG